MALTEVCPTPALLSQLATGSLPDDSFDFVAKHVEACHACAAQLQTLAPNDTLADAMRGIKTMIDEEASAALAGAIAKLRDLAKPDAIHWHCAHCQKRLKVKSSAAGKNVKCPHCGIAERVPLAEIGAGKAPLVAPTTKETPTSPGTIEHPKFVASPQVWEFLAPAEQPDEIGRLGPYRILEVLGAGGMGVVFKAEDPHLERLVALKAMLPSLGSNPAAKQRFFLEAKAAAGLKHPRIVTIHAVGEDRGAPFLAMEFLEGEALESLLKRTSQLDLHSILEIGRQIAEGLAAAHDKGLIHRDIKPANIWLEGQKVPDMLPKSDLAFSTPETIAVKILDFGLARAIGSAPQLTQTGHIVGTPAYMAPEQARAKDVDSRCDLFSFGVVLYRMATGTLPFTGDDTLSILSALALDTPVEPRQINPQIPEPLNRLIVALLAKSPADRPASARAVAGTLANLSTAAPPEPQPKSILAKPVDRPPTVAVQPQPPRNRSRLWWLAAGAGLPALLVAIAGIIIYWPTPHGTVSIESDDPNVEIVFDATGPTIKGISKSPITLQVGPHALVVKRGDFELLADRFEIMSGQSTTLKVALLKEKIYLIRDNDGKTLMERKLPHAPERTDSQIAKIEPPKKVQHLENSPKPPGSRNPLGDKQLGASTHLTTPATNSPTIIDDRLTTAISRDPSYWNCPAKTFTIDLNAGKSYAFDLTSPQFNAYLSLESASGSIIASDDDSGGGRDARLYFQPKSDGRFRIVVTAFSSTPYGDGIGTFQLTVAESALPPRLARVLTSFHGHGRAVMGVAFSPDGKRVVSCRGFPSDQIEIGPDIKVWDSLTGEELLSLKGHGGGVECVTFNADGSRILSGSQDGTAKVWSAVTGQEIFTLKGHKDRVTSVAFSSDSRQIASGSWDKSVRVWDAMSGNESQRLEGHTGHVRSVVFSTDGQKVVSGSMDGSVKIWDLKSGKEIRTIKGHSGGVTSVSLSPDANTIVSGVRTRHDKFGQIGTGQVRVLDAKTGEERFYMSEELADIYCVAFSADGAMFAAGGEPSTLNVWDAKTGKKTLSLSGSGGGVFGLAFSPDGNRLVSGSWDGSAKVWDIKSQTSTAPPLSPLPASPTPIATQPQPQTPPLRPLEAGDPLYPSAIVTRPASLPGVRSWSIETVIPRTSYRDVFANQEKTVIASKHSDGTIRLWNKNENLLAFFPREELIDSARFDWKNCSKLSTSGSSTFSLNAVDESSGKILQLTLRQSSSLPTAGLFPNFDGSKLFADLGLLHGPVVWQPGNGTFEVSRRDVGASIASLPSPSGKLAVRKIYKASNNFIQIVTTDSWHVRNEWKFAHNDRLQLTWGADEETILGVSDNFVVKWNSKGDELHKIDLILPSVFVRPTVSPDLRWLAYSWQNSIQVIDVATGKKHLTIQANAGSVPGLAFSPNSKLLSFVEGDEIRSLRIWDIEEKKRTNSVSPICDTRKSVPVSACFSPNGERIACITRGDIKAFIWNSADNATESIDLRRILANRFCNSMCWSPDSRFLYLSINMNGPQWSIVDLTTRKERLIALPLCFRAGHASLLILSPEGHYRVENGPVDIVYVAQTDRGYETLTPAEFEKRFGWKNDPAKATLAGQNGVAPVATTPELKSAPPNSTRRIPGTNAEDDKNNLATTPIVRDVDLHKQFLEIAKKGNVDVLFLGDSITQGWGNNKTWKAHFEPLKAANFGIGGDQTGHVLWRITEGKELEGISPKVAVLMIGTNNSGRDSAPQIAEGIELIVKTIQQKSPKTKVLLLGVFPRGEKAGTPIRAKLEEINKTIAKLDDGGKTVKYLDIGQKFLATDGTLTKEIMPDYLHLSGRGYEIWAEAITPTLTEMLK